MLLWLSQQLSFYFHHFHVVQYLTLRAILGTLTALAMGLLLGPYFIERLGGQVVRDDGPQTHLTKAGTPTMGGMLILTAVVISTLLWSDLSNRYVWLILAVTIGFGLI